MRKVLILAAIVLLVGFFLGFNGKMANDIGIGEEVTNSQGANVDDANKDEKPPQKVPPGLQIAPERPIQGEPVLVTIKGTNSTTTAKSLVFNGKSVRFFNLDGKLSALIGIDLRLKPGTYPLVLTLTDGQKIKKDIVVDARHMPQGELGIPDKLGGNTQEAEKKLVSNLVSDGAQISAVSTANTKLWNGAFRFPLDGEVVVSDPYGYGRQTVGTVISHKGTDFKAPEGTPIHAMNSGVVRFAKELVTYGNTVVVDHGLGVHTIYMHLSEIDVAVGDEVSKGEVLGKSGQTGYAFGPHLHLTVRINGISIDPMKFLSLFGTTL